MQFYLQVSTAGKEQLQKTKYLDFYNIELEVVWILISTISIFKREVLW